MEAGLMITCEIWQCSAGALPRLDGYSIAVVQPFESAPVSRNKGSGLMKAIGTDLLDARER